MEEISGVHLVTKGLGMLPVHHSLETLESTCSGAMYLTSGTLNNNNQLPQMDQKMYI